MKLGPLHPKAGWGVTRGQVTKTAPLVKNYRQVLPVHVVVGEGGAALIVVMTLTFLVFFSSAIVLYIVADTST